MKTPFTPHTLPIQNLDYGKLLPLVGKANSLLSNYNGLLSHMVNPLLLLNAITTQEAVLSSRIEGTQASFTEVLEHDSIHFKDERKVADIEEVNNYKKALEYGIKELDSRPLCLSLIRDIHSILLQGVRGTNKARGEFRRVQNYIGSFGTTIEQARFIPPSPDKMLPALNEWEKYIHNEEGEILIQLAVIHAQFETIHPFLDGNGRVGRILIPLFLYARKYLNQPIFYLSEYLESYRGEYYDRLLNISDKEDWQGWIEFFLRAIIKQSEMNQFRATRILELYDKTKAKVKDSQILDLLFKKPILTAPDILKEKLVKNSVSANRLMLKLCESEVLIKMQEGSGTRPAIYGFGELLKLVDNRNLG